MRDTFTLKEILEALGIWGVWIIVMVLIYKDKE